MVVLLDGYSIKEHTGFVPHRCFFLETDRSKPYVWSSRWGWWITQCQRLDNDPEICALISVRHGKFSAYYASQITGVLTRGTSLASDHRQEGKLSTSGSIPASKMMNQQLHGVLKGTVTNSVRLNYICFDRLVVKVMSSV